ncbi:MAG: DNA alkylation repair protein, partial [Propionibacteriaceae bacterium]|nr:DNA alkylation repair protein [Propionibacteriaceae bacterium]
MTAELDYREVFDRFEAAADPALAEPMRRYMRDQFEFLGLKTPLRRSLQRPLIQAARRQDQVDWELVEAGWAEPAREFQYLAVDYLRAVAERLVPGDLPRLRALAQRKSWWDTIDGLVRVVGAIAGRFPPAQATVLEWSLDPDFWIRRIAIEHQLTLGRSTDTARLA